MKKEKGEERKMYLLNLSGHPVPQCEYEFEQVVNVPITNVDMSVDGIQRAAFDIVAQLPLQQVMTGQCEIILPGLTPLAAAVLAILHGISGIFLPIRFAVRTENGFTLSDRLDLFQLRLSARDWRKRFDV